jgi:hypothetical protein
MLIISGDSDAADAYFTEYMRIFQHFYARWWAAQLTHIHHEPATSDISATDTSENSETATSHSYLSEDDSWQIPYWNPRSSKYRERDLYANQVRHS